MQYNNEEYTMQSTPTRDETPRKFDVGELMLISIITESKIANRLTLKYVEHLLLDLLKSIFHFHHNLLHFCMIAFGT